MAAASVPNSYPAGGPAPRPTGLRGVEQQQDGVIARLSDVRVGNDGLSVLFTAATRRRDLAYFVVDGGTVYPRDPAAVHVQVVAARATHPSVRLPAHVQTTAYGRDESGLQTSETELWIPWPPDAPPTDLDDEFVLTARAPHGPHLELRVPGAVITGTLRAEHEDRPRLRGHRRG